MAFYEKHKRKQVTSGYRSNTHFHHRLLGESLVIMDAVGNLNFHCKTVTERLEKGKRIARVRKIRLRTDFRTCTVDRRVFSGLLTW